MKVDGNEIDGWDAIDAMRDGDLKPLAGFIRAGGILASGMAEAIAMAIEGVGPIRLRAEQLTSDRKPISEHQARYDRKLKIGIWIEKRLRTETTLKWADAIADAQAEFAISRKVAVQALAGLRMQLRGQIEGMPDGVAMDLVELSNEFPGEWGGRVPQPKRRVGTK